MKRSLFICRVSKREFLTSHLCRLQLLLLAVASVAAFTVKGADPYTQLAEELTAPLGTNKPPVGVGNFPYQDTEQLSKFSGVIRERLTATLATSGRIRLVLPSRIAALQKEGVFQGPAPLDPDVPPRPVNSPQLKALVRGRYYLRETNVIIKAELLLLESGKVLPTAEVSLGSQRDVSPGWLGEAELVPFNFEVGQKNILDVLTRSREMRHDFPIALAVKEAKREFLEGDSVSYYIQPKVACHIAVFDHQVDGSTVLLFPNAHNTNTFIPPQVFTEIPGANASGFFLRIAEPFGADVIQIIACTKNSLLHQEMARLAQETPKKIALAMVPRGVIGEAIGNMRPRATDGDAQFKPQWTEARLVICTRPKPGL